KALPPGSWIKLPRVDVTRIKEGRIPNRADLDAAAPNNPAVFTWQYASKVVQVLNTRAIAAAGITKDTSPPTKRSKIHLGPDGTPTGVIDNASGLVDKFISARVSDERY